MGKSKISSGMEFSKLFGKLSAVKFLRRGFSAFLEILCNGNEMWILSEFIKYNGFLKELVPVSVER